MVIQINRNELKTHWETDEEARGFLGNALRCYEKVINECKDPQFIKNAKNQIEWIRPLYNLQNKGLVIKELQKIIAKRDKS